MGQAKNLYWAWLPMFPSYNQIYMDHFCYSRHILDEFWPAGCGKLDELAYPDQYDIAWFIGEWESKPTFRLSVTRIASLLASHCHRDAQSDYYAGPSSSSFYSQNPTRGYKSINCHTMLVHHYMYVWIKNTNCHTMLEHIIQTYWEVCTLEVFCLFYRSVNF